jgi:hypothetical protein
MAAVGNVSVFVLFLTTLASSKIEKLRVQYDEGAEGYDPTAVAKPTNFTASSTLVHGTGSYAAKLAADDDPKTAWCEGKDGDGIQEWIRFDFGAPTTVKELFFTPFYAKSKSTFESNGRVRGLRIEMEGGYQADLEFRPPSWCGEECQSPYDAPFVVLTKALKTRWIKFTILSVYRGKSGDTCISEIIVLGRR